MLLGLMSVIYSTGVRQQLVLPQWTIISPIPHLQLIPHRPGMQGISIIYTTAPASVDVDDTAFVVRENL